MSGGVIVAAVWPRQEKCCFSHAPGMPARMALSAIRNPTRGDAKQHAMMQVRCSILHAASSRKYHCNTRNAPSSVVSSVPNEEKTLT